ncbi:MAG: porphobilinogen deaminase [Geoglossum umbratile]|nr:MAG: porphobilinogen deaminase [Geoglossum umbratile]
MSIMGDKNQVTPLHNFGAKSLWTHELEAGLMEGALDLIVHSLKVLAPTIYTTLASLHAGSIIGTSSVRRAAQIARKYPHLRFADVRGNIGTRLAKLDAEDGMYTALVLAAAGLRRLGLAGRISQSLDAQSGGLLHAVGQEALGVEIREGDERIRRLLEPLADEATTRACLAERALMRTLEGGCSVPIGVETSWIGEDKQTLRMRAVVVSLNGSEAAEEDRGERVRSREEAGAFGQAMARELVERGAGRILEVIAAEKGGSGDASGVGELNGGLDWFGSPYFIAAYAFSRPGDGRTYISPFEQREEHNAHKNIAKRIFGIEGKGGYLFEVLGVGYQESDPPPFAFFLTGSSAIASHSSPKTLITFLCSLNASTPDLQILPNSRSNALTLTLPTITTPNPLPCPRCPLILRPPPPV